MPYSGDSWYRALTMPTCEPRPWRDYVRLPWSLVRYAFAWCWYWSWRSVLIIRYWGQRKDPCWRWYIEPGNGRHTAVDPVMCSVCWWAGPVRWLSHGYSACGDEDVEPTDFCPICDTEI